MAMKEYTITVADGMETTVLLSDEDAKARGLKSTAAKQATPEDKSVKPSDKRAEAVSKSFGGSKG